MRAGCRVAPAGADADALGVLGSADGSGMLLAWAGGPGWAEAPSGPPEGSGFALGDPASGLPVRPIWRAETTPAVSFCSGLLLIRMVTGSVVWLNRPTSSVASPLAG